jgi:hypothetical protein
MASATAGSSHFLRSQPRSLLAFFDLRRLLFADGTPHQVSFPEGVACQSAEQLNDLFLIDNDPVGLGQNGGEQRVLLYSTGSSPCMRRMKAGMYSSGPGR